jgi:hypothetical protein
MAACPDLSTDVTDEEAYAVLEPYFLAARESYEEATDKLELPAKEIKKVRFEIWRGAHDKARHFAACEETGRVILAAPEMVELADKTVIALFLHEFGHAIDFLFPGKFSLSRDEIEVLPRLPSGADEDKRVQQFLAARYRQWERRSRDTIEITADKIAEMVSGHRIGYVGPCMLQQIDAGRPRPKGLR